MYYILFNKDTKKVVQINQKDYLSYGENLQLVIVETLPEKYDYLTVENIRGGEVIDGVKTPITCDLIPQFRVRREPTPEQLNKLKEKQYNARVTQLVRVKYDANAVEALLANYAENKEKYQAEFDAFAAYRKQCKEQAHKEIYGE